MNIAINQSEVGRFPSTQKLSMATQAAKMVPAMVTALAPVVGGTYEQLASE